MTSNHLIQVNKTDRNVKNEGYCNVKLESVLQLKNSTKMLLCLIDDLQQKFTPAKPIPSAFGEKDIIITTINDFANEIDDLPETSSLKTLKNHIKDIDRNSLAKPHKCTVYDRLTRKCNCLNRKEFNDLTIQFNEDSKYRTSELGEIIKNLRILKKILYMGGEYCKNALIFLNEGLSKCPYSEKVDIILACSHADICNVFDDDSIVKILIRNPIKYEAFGDNNTQSLAARVLYRIAAIEEGRRYLNFNSKILTDLNNVIKKKTECLNSDTKEFLNTAVNLLKPTNVPLFTNSVYYCKADEGLSKKILNSLHHFREYMTTEEIIVNLEWLNKFCDSERGIKDMRQNLISTCTIFKELLLTYDNNKINVIATSIINKLLKIYYITRSDKVEQKSYIVTDTATEPTEMKDEVNQAPSSCYNNSIKKHVRSRLGMSTRSNKSMLHQPSLLTDITKFRRNKTTDQKY